jgi:hypothetical protein
LDYVFTAIFVVCIDVLTPVLTLLFICSLSFAHNKYNNAACRFTFTTSYQILQEIWWHHTSKKNWFKAVVSLLPAKFQGRSYRYKNKKTLAKWDAIQTVACMLDLSTFFRIREKYAYKILKTSHEELFDLVSLTNADLETTMNKASYTNRELEYISYHLYHQTQSPCIPTALLCAASQKEPKYL